MDNSRKLDNPFTELGNDPLKPVKFVIPVTSPFAQINIRHDGSLNVPQGSVNGTPTELHDHSVYTLPTFVDVTIPHNAVS